VLAQRLRPDVVVGASAGALNAWAIAGGAGACGPDRLLAGAGMRIAGIVPVPASPLARGLRRPAAPCAHSPAVGGLPAATGNWRGGNRDTAPAAPAVRGPEIEWRHLAASTAVSGVLPASPDRRPNL